MVVSLSITKKREKKRKELFRLYRQRIPDSNRISLRDALRERQECPTRRWDSNLLNSFRFPRDSRRVNEDVSNPSVRNKKQNKNKEI